MPNFKPIIERFRDKYIPEPNSGCWLWTGAIGRERGYGMFSLGDGKEITGAHRASWILHNGDIPKGKYVLHKCDVKCCVNPNHLYIGTHQDNMNDMVARGRSKGNPGETNGQSKLTKDEVCEIKIMLKDGMLQKEIASFYNVHKTTICDINRGATWKWL